MALIPGTKLAVFSIKKDRKEKSTIWTRAGTAFINKDGSINVWLDVLPIEGTLHCREQVVEKREAVVVPGPGVMSGGTDLAMADVGGNS